MKRMTARYAGKCYGCHGAIAPGDEISFAPGRGRAKGRAWHLGCEGSAAGRSSRARGVVWSTSGGEFYQNERGRCEDAPCCGCCS